MCPRGVRAQSSPGGNTAGDQIKTMYGQVDGHGLQRGVVRPPLGGLTLKIPHSAMIKVCPVVVMMHECSNPPGLH